MWGGEQINFSMDRLSGCLAAVSSAPGSGARPGRPPQPAPHLAAPTAASICRGAARLSEGSARCEPLGRTIWESGGGPRGSCARGGQAPSRRPCKPGTGRARAPPRTLHAACVPARARARVAVPGIDNWEVSLRSVARCYAQGLPRGACVRGSLTPSQPGAGPPPRTRSLRPVGPGIPMGARRGGGLLVTGGSGSTLGLSTPHAGL